MKRRSKLAKPVKAWCWKSQRGKLDFVDIWTFAPKQCDQWGTKERVADGLKGGFVKIEIREIKKR